MATGAAAVAGGGLGWTLGAVADPPRHAIAVALLFLGYLAVRPLIVGARPFRIPYPLPIGLYVAASVLAATTSPEPDLNSLLAWLGWPAIGILVFDLAQTPRIRALAVPSLTALLAAVAAASLGAWLTGVKELRPFTAEGTGRLTWPFSHPNLLGVFLVMLLPLAVVTAVRHRGWARWAAVATCAIGLVALAATLSRTSWVAAIVGAVVVVAYGAGRRAVPVAGAGILLAASPFIAARLLEGDAGTGNVRLRLWTDALRAFREHPLTGVGHGGFPDFARPMIAQLNEPVPVHAHNLYLNFATELGIVGVLSLVALLVTAIVSAHRGTRSPDRHDRTLSVGLVGGLAALATAGILDYPLAESATILMAWVLLGLAAAVGLAGRRPSRARGEGSGGGAAPDAPSPDAATRPASAR